MGRPRVNVGDCKVCNLKAAWTKGLCRGCYSAQRYRNDPSQKEARRLYNQRNLDKIRKRKYNREQTDLAYKTANRLRCRLNKALKAKNKVGSAWDELGCTFEEFKKYMESKFQEGMDWSNWSKTGWHIDHIKPLASFDLTNPNELKQAVHYTNLQPLWAKDNLRKGDQLGTEE